MKFTIIIPTYNRGRFLKRTLQALQAIDFNPRDFEVIIVDNNSTDTTATIIKNAQKKTPYALQYIFEPQQGRTFASLAGIRAATHSHIVFLDDDISFTSNLLKLYELAYTYFPQAAAVGGPITATFDQPVAGTFLALATAIYPWIFGEVNHGEKVCRVKPPNGLFAGNMSLNLREFSTTDIVFSDQLGRPMRNRYLYAEDFELCLRLHYQQKLILYMPQLKVENVVEANRLTIGYIWNRLVTTGIEFYFVDQMLKKYPQHRSLAPFTKMNLWQLPIYIGYWLLGPQYAKSMPVLQS
jgi:glucosyl-dolichyl phosphate glucuronosyltransferase